MRPDWSQWATSGDVKALDPGFALVVSLLFPGVMSAVQPYRLLGWDLYLSFSFETVIHSVHALNRILPAWETEKLILKNKAAEPAVLLTEHRDAGVKEGCAEISGFLSVLTERLSMRNRMSLSTTRVPKTNPVSWKNRLLNESLRKQHPGHHQSSLVILV